MPDQVLQDIKDRLNIVDVLGGYIQLKKAGVNYKTPCPFHSEKSASFIVSPQKQIWHCFGCGEGGDIFGFVQRYENVDFKESLKILADRAGVVLPKYSQESVQQEEVGEKLLRINDFAARFYHEILLKDKRGTEGFAYIRQRGLSEETVKKWNIGFAPDAFHVLEQALVQKKVALTDLITAGVSARSERGQVYDRFRGRITFPIYNFNGQVVGFSARILPKEAAPNMPAAEQAKYINSPETPIYNKSKVLFGLFQAKNAIRKMGETVIVEGQMDCIAAHQAGFTNVVATSGTALTEQQLVLLGRLTKNLKFCFDGDTAGQDAARRAGELALQKGFRLKLIVLKAVKDPDELIKKSPGLWEKAVREAVWFLDFYIEAARSKASEDPVSQMHYLTSEVMPLVGYIQDRLEQDHYVRQLTEKYGISERVVRQQIQPKSVTSVEVAKPLLQKNPLAVLEKEMLGGCLVYPEFLLYVVREGSLADFETEEIVQILEPAFLGNSLLSESFVSPLAKEAQFMVESRVAEEGLLQDVALKQLEKSFALFKLQAIKKQLQKLTQAISLAQARGQKEEVGMLNREFAELSQQRMKYEQKV